MKLTAEQLEVMDSDEHLLVTGGPGSGKTTISILKAARIAEQCLRPQQKVLFLSFARASVSRVVEAIEQEQSIARQTRQKIEVETYHSFFWRILKAHGYLIGLPRRLDILTPPAEAVALSVIRRPNQKRNKKRDAEVAEERKRLSLDEGRICFDLFAPFVGDLLHGSKRLRCLLATMYPTIILDEFQDTNAEQWRVVKGLGVCSQLIALADPEQRIFDFMGADPLRIDHFLKAFNPTKIDFSDTNHRSAGTDIAKFGNAILSGLFNQKSYKGIRCLNFGHYADQAMTELVTTTHAARKRLVNSGSSNWSLAILVPTKKMTRLVSDKFREPPEPIAHNAVIELEAAILGSEIVAHLLQPAGRVDFLVYLLCNYYQGKGGDRPTKSALAEADRLRKAYDKWHVAPNAGKSPPSNSLLHATFEAYNSVHAIKLTGDPDKDWRLVRAVLENGACKRLKDVASEVRNIRLLERGTQLRQALAQNWRNDGCYSNALEIVKKAFVQEHFAASAKPESGVVVMNMHKAKGKQFDEVIIFEGWPKKCKGQIVANPNRIVRNNDRAEINDSSRQNFRVSVTRAKQRTTILTPKSDPCVLLY